jgi:hypothetical protein
MLLIFVQLVSEAISKGACAQDADEAVAKVGNSWFCQRFMLYLI